MCRHPLNERNAAICTYANGQQRYIGDICQRCGHWLGLGPANDSDPRVAVEREAARLCAEWKPIGGVLTTEGEYKGWAGWPHRQPTNEDEWAGFHAAQIANHDREQAGLAFTGQHLADHALPAAGTRQGDE